MFLFSRRSTLIGLDIQPQALVMVELAKHQKRFQLVQLQSVPLLPGIIAAGWIANWQAFERSLCDLVKDAAITGSTAVIALPAQRVIRKCFTIKSNYPANRISRLVEDDLIQASQAMSEKWLSDYHLIPTRHAAEKVVSYISAREQDVWQYYQCVASAGLKVKILEMDLHALVRVFVRACPPARYAAHHHLIIYEVQYVTRLVVYHSLDITAVHQFVCVNHSCFVDELIQQLNHFLLKLNPIYIERVVMWCEHFQSDGFKVQTANKECTADVLNLASLFTTTDYLPAIMPHLFACGLAMRDKPKW